MTTEILRETGGYITTHQAEAILTPVLHERGVDLDEYPAVCFLIASTSKWPMLTPDLVWCQEDVERLAEKIRREGP
jgi:hypothetical protein